MCAVFALNGLGFAASASRIPAIKSALGLDPGGLGALLMFMSVGALLGLPLAGAVTARIGGVRTILGGVCVFSVGLVTLGLAADVWHSFWLAGIGYLMIGAGSGTWDVAMNLEGTVVERALGRAIMPWFHAAFSGGTVVMALLSVGLIAMGVPVWLHLCAVAALWPVLGLLAVPGLLPRSAPSPAEDRPRQSAASAWLEPRTLLIGVVVLAVALTEGTANDWISVAFVNGYHLPEWAGVLGFATFLVAMTFGRLVGTAALDRYGRVPMLSVLFVLAAAGCALVVFGGPVLAFVGSALWGIGASLGFPVGISAASDDPSRAAARVSVVSTIGYMAFLGGPPLLGFLGNHVGVLRSLLVVGVMALVALLLVPATRELPEAAQAQ